MKLSELPIIKFLIFLAPGFFIALLFNPSFISALLVIFPLIIIIILIFLLKKYFLTYLLISLLSGYLIGLKTSGIWLEAPDKIVPEIPAVFQGEIKKLLNNNEKYTRCLCEGWLDAKPLNKINKTRLILVVIHNDNKFQLKTGSKIFSNLYIKPPQKSRLASDFPEWQYCTSNDVQWLARSNSDNTAILGLKYSLYTFVEKLSNDLKIKLENLFDKNSAPIVNALLLGDKSGLSQETKKIFSLSGTAHVIAVSGLHVGIISGIIFVLLGFIHYRWLKFIIFSFCVIAFVIITGMQPSAIRAGIMSIAVMLLFISERKINMLNILGLAVIAAALFTPELLFSIGFHLSILAILGIVLLYKSILNFLKNIFKSNNLLLDFFVGSISITFAASIVVSPIVAYYFRTFSIVSPLANLFVVPFFSLSMVFSIIALLLSYIFIPAAMIYSTAADLLISLSQKINQIAISLSSAYIQGEQCLYISIAISILLIYFFTSKTLNQSAFRLVISLIAFMVFMSIYNYSDTQNSINVYPRNQFVAVVMPSKNNSRLVLLVDRKPSQYAVRDIGMEKFISDIKDNVLLGISGNASLLLYDNISKVRNAKYIELSYDLIERIRKKLYLKTKLPQLINTDYEYRNHYSENL